ncbi:hypothetical protein [Enterococcus sp. AZ103]|uniref:hypothetical protein n=1 Tax=Enterococcus sp. AZ103 TaxID=2774628 RepID=UPI003F22E2CB
MPKKNRIDTLKEQISFIEARITRYQELGNGGIFKRILFGGGKQAKLDFIGLLVGFLLLIYSLIKSLNNWHFIVMMVLSIVVLFYAGIQLNVIRKKNPAIKYQKIVASLIKEEESMNQELGRLLSEAADDKKLKSVKKQAK